MTKGQILIGVALFALAWVLQSYVPYLPKVGRALDDLHELRTQLPELQKKATEIKKLVEKWDKSPFFQPESVRAQ